MGKRSNFQRRDRDFYPTPPEAVRPLLPFIPRGLRYWEPCAGHGDLIYSLQASGAVCCAGTDIHPDGHTEFLDAFDITDQMVEAARTDMFITNPPWSRDVLHPMIEHFSAMRPTWLLFDADWVHTKQSAPYLPWLRKIVSVGRVKWIPDSKMTGKDNCAWHLFDQNGVGATEFFGRAA